ncbi:hypothetical protein [Tabrizicola sp.]|uniref:hypothetical protein n=1 Tax=Tabrizicola sp. TaxID=2005166 RepID=UPI003D29CA58
MAYIACPSCSADFFSQLEVGDFVCPSCKQYFQIDNIEGETRDPQVYDNQIEPTESVSFVSNFDKWLDDEVAWMAKNTLEPPPLELEKELREQRSESGKKIIGLSPEKNTPLHSRDYPEHRVVPPPTTLGSSATADIDDEPMLFKLALPTGAIVAIGQYAFEPLNPILFIFIFFIWGFISVIGIAFWLGLGGGRVKFGALSSLSLGVFALVALLAALSGIFSGGTGAARYNDCIEVGRYGQVQCF